MRDETLIVGNLLGTRDPQTLTFFQGLHKSRCLKETVMGPHVKPRKAAPHSPYLKLAPLEIGSNDIADLQFARGGRLEAGRDINDLRIAKVETRDSPIRAGYARLFLNRKGTSMLVKFDNTVALRIVDVIRENGRTGQPYLAQRE